MPVMFNHRHYAAIAKVISETAIRTEDERDMLRGIVDGFETLFEGDNPKFDQGRFRAACTGKPLTRKDAR